MEEADGIRFGFVVDEETAKKFYAVWNHRRETDNLKTTMTDVFRDVVGAAFLTIPEAHQDLGKIKLPPAKRKAGQNIEPESTPL